MTQNRRKTLSEKRAGTIRELIHKNILEGRAKLNEVDNHPHCGWLDVRRTLSRGALGALCAEGPVQIPPNRRAFVVEISMKELQHASDVMSILEGSCAGLAAERLTNADLNVKTKGQKPNHIISKFNCKGGGIAFRDANLQSIMDWSKSYNCYSPSRL